MILDSPTIESLQTEIADLRRQLSLYTSFVAQLPLGLYIYHLEDPADDRTLRMIATNPAASAMTGVAMEAVLGNTLDENFPGLRDQGVPQAYAQVVRSGEAFAVESLAYGDDRVIQAAFAINAVPLPDNCMAVTFDNITARKQTEQALRERETQIQKVVASAPILLLALDPQGAVTLAEGHGLTMAGRSAADLLGHSLLDLGGDRQALTTALRQALGGKPATVLAQFDTVIFELILTPTTSEQGAVTGLIAVGIDVTARQQAEAALRAASEREAVIAAQAHALRELSTPLIPLAAGVVVMPLVGTIDSARSQQVMETLLEGIVAHQADVAILDITGVPVVDTQVADALLRAARAVRLIGAQVVLTGIGAGVAQALVHLGANLTDIVTLSNLQNGIAYALEQQALPTPLNGALAATNGGLRPTFGNGHRH